MKPIQVLFDEPLLKRLDADEEVRALGRAAPGRDRIPPQAPSADDGGGVSTSLCEGRESRRRTARLAGRGRMAREIARGEIWSYAFSAPDKRRPVLIIARQDFTSTIHGAPSEVIVGVAEGLKHDSAVHLDHVQTIEQARLTRRMGHVSAAKMREVCRALSIAVGCAD